MTLLGIMQLVSGAAKQKQNNDVFVSG